MNSSFLVQLLNLQTAIIAQKSTVSRKGTHNPRRRLFPWCFAALAVGTGHILGACIKDAAYNAFSIENVCESTDDSAPELDQATTQQKIQQKPFKQYNTKNEKLARLHDDIRVTEASFKRIKKITCKHISQMLDSILKLEYVVRFY